MPTAPPSVRVTTPVNGVSGTTLYEALDPTGAPLPGPRVAVVARMHGNEPVGDPVLSRIAEVVQSHLACGSLLCIRANELAAAQELRHTQDGQDMNRLWDTGTLSRLRGTPIESMSYEEVRALTLAPMLIACDGVLDLHSTSRPAAPFLVMRDDQAHATMALKLGVERLVTGVHENAILSGGVSANVGLLPAERSPRIGFTFEAGQHTDPENAARAWEVTIRYLAGFGIWLPVPEPPTVRTEVYEVTERFVQAGAGTEPFRFVGYDGGEPGGGRHGLPQRHLHSFEEIQADEVVLRRGRAEVVRAHSAFMMLMPAPATPPGTDLYYVAQPRQGGLSEGVARTDAQARREAHAIERMLDLLGDDEFERGTTWVAFVSRRLFDLCATIVARTLRLDPADPHRKITVMGRGDTGGDEVERRAGHRYRDAMRRAIAQGVPVERIQLLRGAPLAWLDALTSHGMLELVAQRIAQRGHSGVRMRVSLRQPHTASLFVGGDVDLALRTGDVRHVRVALLIEAATVEPDGATARVRVVRTGLVSCRVEVLKAASSLLRALREDHRTQVHHGALRDEPAIQDLLLEDDAIEAVAEPERMAGLRSALYRAQLRLWCDQLRLEVPEVVHLPTDEALGRWLARTMSATGILDAEALRALTIRPDGKGYRADPETMERLYDRVHASTMDVPPVLRFGPAPPPTPPQPLLAADVTADDLERWVSWMRFVRGVSVVPETRGKDLDLALSGADIRTRLVRWFDTARRMSANRPGEVLVVIAGDGLNPTRDQMGDAFELYRAHRALILDSRMQYLRIQHAQGTHLAWMKDFLVTLSGRPPSQHPMSFQFEAEHGATVSVILVLERDATVPEGTRPWSLDGWDLTMCGVVLSDLESKGSDDYKVGLFTERGTARRASLNQELLHFGRAHCEGLLSQVGSRVVAVGGASPQEALETLMVQQMAHWIARVRVWATSSQTVPEDVYERGAWIAQRLGLADAWLGRALGRHMDTELPPPEAARRIWESVPAWPGPVWNARADGRSETPDRQGSL